LHVKVEIVTWNNAGIMIWHGGREGGRDVLSKKEKRKSVVFILVDHAVMTVLT